MEQGIQNCVGYRQPGDKRHAAASVTGLGAREELARHTMGKRDVQANGETQDAGKTLGTEQD